MPDFELTVSGVTVQPWLDPPENGMPSRLNPKPGRNMLRLVAQIGATVTLTAVVSGVSGPLDSALGVRLFVCSCAENPGANWSGPLPFAVTSGQSSVQSFVPATVGHYLIYMRRPGGGQVFVHIDAEAA